MGQGSNQKSIEGKAMTTKPPSELEKWVGPDDGPMGATVDLVAKAAYRKGQIDGALWLLERLEAYPNPGYLGDFNEGYEQGLAELIDHARRLCGKGE